ncbi:MAG: MraY family glycosyltransferase [Parabacteroides sp.]
MISQVLHIAFQRKLFDIPNERKVHQQMVPRLGGIIFKPVLCFSITLLVLINVAFGIKELPLAVRENALPLAYLYCAVTLLHFVGIVDDLKGVDYHIKFLAQIICGMLFVSGKILIIDFNGLFGIYALPTWVAIPFTIFVMVYVINAINLIDGIDGLASALCAIVLIFYGEFFFIFHQYIEALLSFAAVGVLIPFYYYNVFGKAEKNRKIFMGDTGTLTMGLLICFLGIRLCNVQDTSSVSVPIDPFLLAFSPLLIPCLDVIKVYLIRVIHGKNPFLPDKNHIHHKLMALGMSQRMTMIVLIMVSGLLISMNVALSIFVGTTVMFCVDLLVWTFMTLLIEHKLNVKENQLNK